MSWREGYSRGGRGNRGRKNEGNWRGGKRNFSDSSQGRFYSSSNVGFGGGNDRFGDDRFSGNYKRSFREANQGFAGFDRHSPDFSSKRLRTDFSPYSGGTSRRSPDRSFGSGGGNDYSSRNLYVSVRSSGDGFSPTEESFREVRESRSGDFSYRKPRGSFRGRSFSRGRSRGWRSGRSDFRRFRSKVDDERRELLRLKRTRRYKESKDDKSDEGEDLLEDENFQESEGEEKEENEQEEGDGKKEEADTEEKKEDVSKESEGEEKEESEDKETKKSPTKKTENGEEENADNKNETADENKVKTSESTKQSTHLYKCPHCGYTSDDTKKYDNHLRLKKHQAAMKLVVVKLRETLARMRIQQRRKQRALDNDHRRFNLQSIFCKICKLIYRTYMSDHMASFAHKRMRNFLFPYCNRCKTSFRTPMQYEEHISQLEHLKRRLKSDNQIDNEDNEGFDSSNELDTSSFVVLDAVGSGDDSEGEAEETDANGVNEQKDEEGESKKGEGEKTVKKKKKVELQLGAEYCKLIEAVYCELCKMHVPNTKDKDKALLLHCHSRGHRNRLWRETKRQITLNREKEKKRKATKKGEKKQDKEKKDDKTEEAMETDQGNVNEDGKQDEVKEEKEQNGENPEEKTETESEKEEKDTPSDSVNETKTEKVEPEVGKKDIEAINLDITDEECQVVTNSTKNSDKKDISEDKIWSEVDKDLSNLLNEDAEEEVKDTEDSQTCKDTKTSENIENQESGKKGKVTKQKPGD